jgi:hypothetical protein
MESVNVKYPIYYQYFEEIHTILLQRTTYGPMIALAQVGQMD